jgi:hypothetical protein
VYQNNASQIELGSLKSKYIDNLNSRYIKIRGSWQMKLSLVWRLG